MTRKVIVITACLLIVFLIAGWLSMTVPANPKRENTKTLSGKLLDIKADAGTGDISLTVENSEGLNFYINRGLQQKLSVEDLKKALLNNEVSISYYNGGLALFNDGVKWKHVCEVRHNDSMIYSEF